MIPLGILAAASVRAATPPVTTQTLLSQINKGPNITLGDGDTSAQSIQNNNGLALSAAGKSAGKFYFEVSCPAMSSVNRATAAGLQRGIADLNNYLGQSVDSWGSWGDGGSGFQRSTYHNAARINVVSVGVAADGQRMRAAVDLDNGRLWLSYFGSTSWIGGGNPAASTLPTYTFTPSGTFYIALNPRNANTRLQLIDPAAWLPAPPAGFGIWTG